MHRKTLLATVAMAALGLSCGSDDDEGGGGGDSSYEELSGALENPTGEVATAEDAQGVAAEYAEALSAQAPAAGGERRHGITCDASSGGGGYSCTCSGGGSISGTASGSQTSSVTTYDYDDCCTEGGCCFNGDGTYYYAQGGTYQWCGDWNIDWECGDGSGTANYSACYGTSGMWILVTYNSLTFAVTGSYDVASQTGSWTITAANGTWTCQSSSGTGSCTDGTTTISWP